MYNPWEKQVYSTKRAYHHQNLSRHCQVVASKIRMPIVSLSQKRSGFILNFVANSLRLLQKQKTTGMIAYPKTGAMLSETTKVSSAKCRNGNLVEMLDKTIAYSTSWKMRRTIAGKLNATQLQQKIQVTNESFVHNLLPNS